MYCPNCGTQNDDKASFCLSCGTPLKQAPAPPAAAPMQAPPASGQPMQAPPMASPGAGPSYVPSQKKPYRAEFALGLTGAIIGSVMFGILVIMAIMELTGDLYYYAEVEGLVTVSAAFCLASFILGFVGSAQINKGNLGGGVSLLVGAGLGFIAMFISLPGLYTLFFWPLLLAASITALARKSTLQKSGNYPQ